MHKMFEDHKNVVVVHINELRTNLNKAHNDLKAYVDQQDAAERQGLTEIVHDVYTSLDYYYAKLDEIQNITIFQARIMS